MTPAQFKDARKAMCYSQHQLAEVMGVHCGTVVALENATGDVPTVYVLAMEALTSAHKALWRVE